LLSRNGQAGDSSDVLQKEVVGESATTTASQVTPVVPFTTSQQLPGVSFLEQVPGAFMPVKGQCDMTSKV